MSRVPSSCFSLANLSPFQTGYGSLQVFSVYQNVPKGAENDMKVTGLRRDQYTAQAPGIFKEEMTDAEREFNHSDNLDFFEPGRRFPDTSPELVCHRMSSLAISCLPSLICNSYPTLGF